MEKTEEKIVAFLVESFSLRELESIRDYADHYHIFSDACKRKISRYNRGEGLNEEEKKEIKELKEDFSGH